MMWGLLSGLVYLLSDTAGWFAERRVRKMIS
jgi:hypothetical protein